VPQPPKKRAAAAAPAVLTQYVVLKAVPLDVLDLDEAQQAAVGLGHSHVTTMWMPVLNQTADEGPDGQIRVIEARDQAKAIEAVTGPDGPDILEGSWKAVALSSWRGGAVTRRTMKSDRLPLDEAIA
jgi:hypothetical protein